MTDYHDKGFACVRLFDPEIALDAWDDIDQYELHKLLNDQSDKPWKVLTPPRTPKFSAFVREIERVSSGFWSRIALMLIGSKCPYAGNAMATD